MSEDNENNEVKVIEEQKPKPKLKILIGLALVIFISSATTYAYFNILPYDSKETIFMVQYPVSLKLVNTTVLPPSPVYQTTLMPYLVGNFTHNLTHVVLKNGETFNDSQNQITTKNVIQVNETYYTANCNFALFDSNHTIINNVFEKLSENNYVINATKNPDCNPHNIKHGISGLKLVQ
jgi:hypothetical protein